MVLKCLLSFKNKTKLFALTPFKQKLLSNPQTQRKAFLENTLSKYLRAHGKPWIERVLTPSLSIIYLPNPRNISKRNCSVLLSFPLLDKIKDGGDSCLTVTFLRKQTKHEPAFQKQSVLVPTDHT